MGALRNNARINVGARTKFNVYDAALSVGENEESIFEWKNRRDFIGAAQLSTWGSGQQFPSLQEPKSLPIEHTFRQLGVSKNTLIKMTLADSAYHMISASRQLLLDLKPSLILRLGRYRSAASMNTDINRVRRTRCAIEIIEALHAYKNKYFYNGTRWENSKSLMSPIFLEKYLVPAMSKCSADFDTKDSPKLLAFSFHDINFFDPR